MQLFQIQNPKRRNAIFAFRNLWPPLPINESYEKKSSWYFFCEIDFFSSKIQNRISYCVFAILKKGVISLFYDTYFFSATKIVVILE